MDSLSENNEAVHSFDVIDESIDVINDDIADYLSTK